MIPIKISHRTLIKVPKKARQKYLVLLSDQTVFIDSEWVAMKRAQVYSKQTGKVILEVLPTNSRLIAQQNGLSKLLESLEVVK